MEFSDKLKQLRSQQGISQAKLAEEIHISRSAVAKWENGLGFPSQESLQLLADYFHLTPDALTENQELEHVLTRKNRTLKQQRTVIFILTAVLLCSLTGAAAFFYPPFQEYLFPFLIGLLISALGIFNMCGNIATIHWYNRRKVKKEDQKAYCLAMGLGTLIMGIGILLFSVLFSVFPAAWVEYSALTIILLGFVLMLYAQFRYNRGLF